MSEKRIWRAIENEDLCDWRNWTGNRPPRDGEAVEIDCRDGGPSSGLDALGDIKLASLAIVNIPRTVTIGKIIRSQ